MSKRRALPPFSIVVRNKSGVLMAEDSATTEEDARQQASGWTGQRGQMTWVARIYGPNGPVATYRRGAVAP